MGGVFIFPSARLAYCHQQFITGTTTVPLGRCCSTSRAVHSRVELGPGVVRPGVTMMRWRDGCESSALRVVCADAGIAARAAKVAASVTATRLRIRITSGRCGCDRARTGRHCGSGASNNHAKRGPAADTAANRQPGAEPVRNSSPWSAARCSRRTRPRPASPPSRAKRLQAPPIRLLSLPSSP